MIVYYVYAYQYDYPRYFYLKVFGICTCSRREFNDVALGRLIIRLFAKLQLLYSDIRPIV